MFIYTYFFFISLLIGLFSVGLWWAGGGVVAVGLSRLCGHTIFVLGRSWAVTICDTPCSRYLGARTSMGAMGNLIGCSTAPCDNSNTSKY